mmetsp:Transcript_56927/g.133110  ORF Transcript_56927/g.133110 Transcript_56927/m.133110 type:complete len:356 (+) Transcript_56927:59-1126(+)
MASTSQLPGPPRRMPVYEPLALPSYDPFGPLGGYDFGYAGQGEPVWSRLKSSIYPVLDLCIDAYYASLSSTFQGEIEFTHHAGAVEELIREGADVEARDEISGGSPLHFAAGAGSHGICKLLISAKARPGARDARLQTPLWWAVAGNHKTICSMLLALDQRQALSANIDHLTPLHQAAYLGRTEIVEMHLTMQVGGQHQPNRCGRNRLSSGPNLRAGKGLLSPLHVACRQGHLAVAALLLQAKGDPLVACSLGRTALHHACAGPGRKSRDKDGGLLEMCHLLIWHRPSILTLRDAYGQTAAELAQSKGFFPPELKLLLCRVPPVVRQKVKPTFKDPSVTDRGRRPASAGNVLRRA